jgi:hypothetical protein
MWTDGRAPVFGVPYACPGGSAVFTILTEYGSHLVDQHQVERLNAAKRARAASVHIEVLCGCGLHDGAVQRLEITLSDVVAVVGHTRSRYPNVVPFERALRSA